VVRVTVHKGRDVKVSIRPLQNFTHFLSALPSLEEGEGITVTAEEGSGEDSRNEEADAMAEQECFCGANAMPEKTCVQSMRGNDITGGENHAHGMGRRDQRGGARHQILLPQMQGPPQGNRRGKDRDVPDTREGVFGGKAGPGCPILRRGVRREEFDEWLRKLPKGKSGGPDEMTYEMWQEAPETMREMLWRSVNSVMEGRQLPEEWTGAFTKLLVKKAGLEGALEDLRPVCLMSTAAKIITGIWAHRLSTTLEEQGVLEDVREGFRPDRSTKRQVLRLLNCINDAKRNGKKLIVAFLDFENYFNAIGLKCLFQILENFGMAKEDVGVLRQYYAHSYFQVMQESGEATARAGCRGA
jgi:hypothetical protein